MSVPRNIGSLTATPNPVISSVGLGRVQLAWTLENAIDVEIRIGSPDGPLLVRSGSAGSTTTGPWVTDGTAFFLQDVSAGRALSPEGTLDCAVVHVTPPRETTQDKVCEFASYLGQRFGCTHIVLADPADPEIASQLAPYFSLVGVGPRTPGQEGPYEAWLTGNLDEPTTIALPDSLLATALVLYHDTQGRLARSGPFLDHLAAWLRQAPVCIVTAPAGTNPGVGAASPLPGEPVPLEIALRSRGLNVAFAGFSVPPPSEHAMAIAVVERGPAAPSSATPSSFRVTAIMTAYNEEDIIVPSITHLLDQRIAVHLVDNWSTDATYQLADKFSGHELFTTERFPADGPSSTYQWRALLQRVEAISRETGADWFIHHDVDEVRASPWPNLSVRDALYRVDQSGFTAVDHTVLEFYPVDDFFPFGGDPEAHLRWFDFGRRADHFVQIKAWKNTGHPVGLAESGGHCARGRPYPYKFLLKHYPVRSQAHGEKKVFAERKARWDPDERRLGWHAHYDAFREGHRFVREAHTLERFEEDRFATRYLIERLSGVGIRRIRPSAGANRPDGPA